jgi:hypothetical protein
MGVANWFYDSVEFADNPALLEGEKIQDASLFVFQTTELDKRDNRGRSVRLLREYLKEDTHWKRDWRHSVEQRLASITAS